MRKPSKAFSSTADTMSLRATAHDDLIEILNDTEDGGVEVTIESPAGSTETFLTLTNDIHLAIDPETGMTVTGRQSSVAVLISELITAGFSTIAGIADKTSKPWVVTATDVNGVEGTYKVAETHPDNGAGLMVLILEEYVSL